MPQRTFAVVVLAAGASRRMGQPKLLLPWKQSTVVRHLISQWASLEIGQLTVVCRADDLGLHTELARAGLGPAAHIINPHPEQGMFSSIRCAACWQGFQPSITRWALTLADQPLTQIDTLRALLEFAAGQNAAIVQPRYRGRPKHPVILTQPWWSALQTTDAANLKSFLEPLHSARRFLDVDDPGLDLDLDEPSDYRRAVELSLTT